MAWERWLGRQVRVTYLWRSWPARLYKRTGGGYRHVCLPPGLWVRWGPPSPREHPSARQHRRAQRWDAVEAWVVRCAVAVGIGVAFGLLLVWLKGQR